jgi:hypothetical protein
MRDYNGLLKRIQRRHGNQRPKTPFSIEQVVEFMDTKKREQISPIRKNPPIREIGLPFQVPILILA